MASSSSLRHEISARNRERACRYPHEETVVESGSSIIYAPHAEGHGNFHPSSWRAILAHPEWAIRLEKTYTASRRVPRSGDRWRGELECATSSDALLMNIFCHPQTLRSERLRVLLGIERGAKPVFGWRPNAPLEKDHADRTEVDMLLSDLLVEAKLCETGFQVARISLMRRYVHFEETFEVERLPQQNGQLRSYQLLRGILAAVEHNARFCLMCDARRADLIEAWFTVLSTVRSSELRCRLQLITWQEIAACLVKPLQDFLEEKYGILSAG